MSGFVTTGLAVIALAGWGVAIVLGGALSVSRRRLKKSRADFDARQYDIEFATEKLREFIDRANNAEDENLRLAAKRRAYESAHTALRSGMVN